MVKTRSLSHLCLVYHRVVTDRQTDRIPIANTRSQQYLPVQLSGVKIKMGVNVPRGTNNGCANFQPSRSESTDTVWVSQYIRFNVPLDRLFRRWAETQRSRQGTGRTAAEYVATRPTYVHYLWKVSLWSCDWYVFCIRATNTILCCRLPRRVTYLHVLSACNPVAWVNIFSELFSCCILYVTSLT